MDDFLDDERYIVLRIDGVPKRSGGLQSFGAGRRETLDIAAADARPRIEVRGVRLTLEQAGREREDAANILARPFPVIHVQNEGVGMDAGETPEAIMAGLRDGAGWGLRETGADAAHLHGGARDVKVAVLDTGIARDHPAFADPALNIERKNFTAGGDDDTNGHGTHCASLIFGRDVDGVRIGVAPAITRAFIGKVFDDDGRSSTEILLNALAWTREKHANVVSLSLGFDFASMVGRLKAAGVDEMPAISHTLVRYREAMLQLQAQLAVLMQETMEDPGALIVAAAGNQSRREAPRPYRIAAGVPAAVPAVISVGALARAGAALAVAPFSNTSPILAAPGVEIVGAKAGGGLVSMSGTSMACPLVAGVATHWWEKENRTMAGAVTARGVAAQLLASARRLPGLAGEDQGRGVVRAPPASEDA